MVDLSDRPDNVVSPQPGPTGAVPGGAAPHRPTRRGFIALAGGVAVVVTAAVAADAYAVRSGVFASGSGPAYAPWSTWQDGPAPLRLIRAAILAANAHNAQAWKFVVSPRRIEVFEDTDRSLGAVDAYRREIHLSVGCAIENLVLAGAAAGLLPTVTLPASGSGGPMAVLDLTEGAPVTTDSYRAIPDRHTDRAAYESGREVPSGVVTDLDALVDSPDVRIQWLLTPAERSDFSDLSVAATEAFIADEQQSADDFSWYRGTWRSLQQHRDGVTADAGGLSPLVRTLGKLTPATATSNGQYWLSGTRDRQLPTASAFAVISVRDSADVTQTLQAGRLYQRMHLWATVNGLSMQPLNQTVERAERERDTGATPTIGDGLTSVLDDPGWQPVMPMRIGYPTVTAPASPRRDVLDVVVTA